MLRTSQYIAVIFRWAIASRYRAVCLMSNRVVPGETQDGSKECMMVSPDKPRGVEAKEMAVSTSTMIDTDTTVSSDGGRGAHIEYSVFDLS